MQFRWIATQSAAECSTRIRFAMVFDGTLIVQQGKCPVLVEASMPSLCLATILVPYNGTCSKELLRLVRDILIFVNMDSTAK